MCRYYDDDGKTPVDVTKFVDCDCGKKWVWNGLASRYDLQNNFVSAGLVDIGSNGVSCASVQWNNNNTVLIGEAKMQDRDIEEVHQEMNKINNSSTSYNNIRNSLSSLVAMISSNRSSLNVNQKKELKALIVKVSGLVK